MKPLAIFAGILEETRPTSGGRYRREISESGLGLTTGDHASVHGPLLGRRYADRRVGFDEERQAAERRLGEPPPDGGGRNAEADFHDPKRSNGMHILPPIPTPGSVARGRGKEAKLCFMGTG